MERRHFITRPWPTIGAINATVECLRALLVAKCAIRFARADLMIWDGFWQRWKAALDCDPFLLASVSSYSVTSAKVADLIEAAHDGAIRTGQ
jgi:hypothetical protein